MNKEETKSWYKWIRLVDDVKLNLADEIVKEIVENVNKEVENMMNNATVTPVVISEEQKKHDADLWYQAKKSKSAHILTLADMLTVKKYKKDESGLIQTKTDYERGIRRIKNKYKRNNRNIQRLIEEYSYLKKDSHDLLSKLVESLKEEIHSL